MCLTLANAATIHHHTDPTGTTGSSPRGYTSTTPPRRAPHPRRPVAPATGPTAPDRHRHSPPARRHRADRPVRQHLDLPRHHRHPHRRPRPPARPHLDHRERRHPMTTNAGHSARRAPVTGHQARAPPAPPGRRREFREHPDDPARSGVGESTPTDHARQPQPGGVARRTGRHPSAPARRPPRSLRSAPFPSAPFPSAPLTDEPARVRSGLDATRGQQITAHQCHHRGTHCPQTRRSTSCPEIPLSPWSGT